MSKRLSFENIDQWLFEYTEGNLSPQQSQELLDFIKMYPELEKELYIWQKSKVVPSRDIAFNSDYLLKPAGFLSKRGVLTAIGAAVILLSLTIFMYYPAPVKYAQSSIDLDIISVESEVAFFGNSINGNIGKSSDILISYQGAGSSIGDIGTVISGSTEHLAVNAVSVGSQGVGSSIGDISTIISGSTEHLAVNAVPGSSDVSSESDIENTAIENKVSSSAVNVSFSKEKETDLLTLEHDFIIDNNSIYNSYYSEIDNDILESGGYLQSDNLEDVISYLNSLNDNDSKGLKQDAHNFINSSVSGRASSLSKSTFKSIFNNSIRNLQNMIDQPLALRNTKRPHYHAPMMTGFSVNPAMVGTAPGDRLQVTSRIQWANQPNMQLMNSLSWDNYSSRINGGFGVDFNFNNYNYNAVNNYAARITYSPKFTINPNTSFEPSISYKMGIITINKTSSSIGGKIELSRNNLLPFFENEVVGTGKQLWYKDVGMGFLLNTKYYYIGFNADNIARHDNNFYSGDLSKQYKEPVYYTAVAGTEYQSITRNMVVNAYAVYQNYGDLSELWVGGNFLYKWFHLGVGASTSFDFGASVGMEFNRFAIRYNSDYLQSRLLGDKFLSHQLTMEVLMKPKRYNAKFLNL